MAVVFWTIGGMVAAFFLILAGALLTPVKFRFFARSAPHPLFRLEARAFAGLTPSLRIADTTRERRKKSRNPKAADKKKSKKGRAMAKRAPAMLKAMPDLVAGLLKTIHFERLDIDGEFGLGDPADTGQLYGRLTPLIYGTAGSRKISVALRPDFDTARLSGTIDAMLSVRPAALLPPAIRFAWRSFGSKR